MWLKTTSGLGMEWSKPTNKHVATLSAALPNYPTHIWMQTKWVVQSLPSLPSFQLIPQRSSPSSVWHSNIFLVTWQPAPVNDLLGKWHLSGLKILCVCECMEHRSTSFSTAAVLKSWFDWKKTVKKKKTEDKEVPCAWFHFILCSLVSCATQGNDVSSNDQGEGFVSGMTDLL